MALRGLEDVEPLFLLSLASMDESPQLVLEDELAG